VSARTQSLILLLFGAALVRLARTDALLRYVRPAARVPVLYAGLGIVLIAGVSVLRRERGAPDQRHGATSRLGWMVLAPVVAVAVIAPPPLGAQSADRPPTAPPRPGHAFTPLAGPDPVPIKLVDVVLRAVWDHGRTLRGHSLRVIGFAVRASTEGFIVARLVITCCAADAEPYDVDVASHGPAPPRGQWVEVTGRFLGMSPDDAVVPLLRATTIRPIAQPANPYD
jgi:uncharacterized repeat protein (TIGR03943 family)